MSDGINEKNTTETNINRLRDVYSFFKITVTKLKKKLTFGDAPMPGLSVLLLTGRTLRQGQGKEYGKLSERYWKSVAICETDPTDMKILGIKENSPIKISTEHGSVVVRAVKSLRAPHPGKVFIPYGPWASLIVSPKTDGTGMPSFKGTQANIELAEASEKVMTLQELLKTHYRKE